MTDTTTKEQVDADNLVDAAARAAHDAASKTLATLEPEQVKFTEHQVAILRQIGLEDANQGDLDLFFHVCRTTGLDPFRKQIYMIGRNTKVTEWVEDERATNGRRKVEKWVTKYTIQTGIDGFRRNGREAAKAYGDTLKFEGPYWCGEDGDWREVWPAETPPVAAKYTVIRNGEPFSAVVHYDEFVQTNVIYEGSGQQRKKVGEEPNSMWAKMPRNQTAKCAEAMAYRRAYPDDFSGLILEDSAQSTVIDQDGNVESAPKQRPRGSGLRDRARGAEQAQEPMDVETVDLPEPDGAPAAEPSKEWDLTPEARKKGQGQMHALFSDGGIAKDEREQRLLITGYIVKRDVGSSNDLTDTELVNLVETLKEWKAAGTIAVDFAEIVDRTPEPATEPVQEEPK